MYRKEVRRMKINGPNQTNWNPYQKQINQQKQIKQNPNQDKLEISQQAKSMQEAEKVSPAREKRIEELKAQVDNGTYKPDPSATAKKMVNFFQQVETKE